MAKKLTAKEQKSFNGFMDKMGKVFAGYDFVQDGSCVSFKIDKPFSGSMKYWIDEDGMNMEIWKREEFSEVPVVLLHDASVEKFGATAQDFMKTHFNNN